MTRYSLKYSKTLISLMCFRDENKECIIKYYFDKKENI